MLSMDLTLNNFPSGHAGPLYRLHWGSPSTNLIKSPTLTLSFDLQANTNPSWTRSSCLIKTPKQSHVSHSWTKSLVLIRSPTATGILVVLNLGDLLSKRLALTSK